MNVLLLNFARFGDILQTQSAITDIVSAGHTVGVACLESFLGAVSQLKGVSHVFPFPSSFLLRSLELKNQENSDLWMESFSCLHEWRKTIEENMKPDVVVNYIPGLSGRILSRFINDRTEALGFGLDKDGFITFSNSWAAMLYGVAAGRSLSPFNVVDLFRKISEPIGSHIVDKNSSDLQPPLIEKVLCRKAKLLEHIGNDCKDLVAFQLGASEEKRRWPVEYFVDTGRRLWESKKVAPVLVGSKGELDLAKKYSALTNTPYVSLVGETGLEDLAEVLSACSLLVTNDTGTMHLAAGLNLPIVAIFLATAQAFDTGPYREGSCCLEPDISCHPCDFFIKCNKKHVCQKLITPEVVSRLVLQKMKEGTWGNVEHDAGVRVWESQFDTHNFMTLKSLSGHGSTDRAIWIIWQYYILRQFIDGKDQEALFFERTPELPDLSASLLERVREEANRLSLMLNLLEQQAKLLTMQALPSVQEKFMSTWSMVYEHLEKSKLFGSVSFLWLQDSRAKELNFEELSKIIRKFSQLMNFFAKAL